MHCDSQSLQTIDVCHEVRTQSKFKFTYVQLHQKTNNLNEHFLSVSLLDSRHKFIQEFSIFLNVDDHQKKKVKNIYNLLRNVFYDLAF